MDLEGVARVATRELVRRGIEVFDVPLRQLFEHDARGELVARADAVENRAELARLALAFPHCDASKSGVSLRRSLNAGADGASLVYAAGARLLLAVEVGDGGAAAPPRAVGLAVTMPVRANVLEANVLGALSRDYHLPTGALFLELVCGAPHTGVASLLLLRLAGRLARAHTGLLAHAVNKRSVALLERHGYGRPTRRADVLYLSREVARIRAASEYEEELLRTGDATRRLCTRAGATARTADRRYWDCRG